MSGPTLAAIVRTRGGELWAGGTRASIPAPGHSPADRSVSLLLVGDRVIVHGFGAADWRSVMDDLRAGGLVDAEGRLAGGGASSTRQARRADPAPTAAERRALPAALRHHSAVPAAIYAGRGPFRPALLAAVVEADGRLCAVELTYLASDGRRARVATPRKLIGVAPSGHAVRLDPAGPGVFTALSASERFGLPAWALLSVGNLRAWSPPAGVRSVLIAADGGAVGTAGGPVRRPGDPVMTEIQTSTARRLSVPLSELGVAPENLRCDVPADEGVPRLADTLAAAGLIYPLVVRPGRKGEAVYMVLDGRRRRFALLLRAERGEIAPDAPVECVLAEGRARQAAAALVTNREQAPVHTADVILAIGRMRTARMTIQAIASALGYELLEVRRLEALARVHPLVLQAFREGRLTLRQVKLFARLKDRARQAELAQSALDGTFHAYRLETAVQGGRVTVADPRLRLVGRAAYAEAGGRLDADLFGELPDVLLDPDLLGRLWRVRAEALGAGLAPEGVAVFATDDSGVWVPDAYQTLPWTLVSSLPDENRAAWEEARAAAEAAAAAIAASAEAPSDAQISVWLQAQLALARAKLLQGEVAAVLLAPEGVVGLDATFLQVRPAPRPIEVYADEEAEPEDPREAGDRAAYEGRDIEQPVVKVDVSGVSHALHETRTDLATRGLIRALAGSPDAALTALVAQLFKLQALNDPVYEGESALSLQARRYGRPQHPAVEALDGEVRRRLAARRDAYRASGLRPVAFVASLEPSERLVLLAELVALGLDLREARTTSLRRAARAEGAEIASLCGGDLTAWWTPTRPSWRFTARRSSWPCWTPWASRIRWRRG